MSMRNHAVFWPADCRRSRKARAAPHDRAGAETHEVAIRRIFGMEIAMELYGTAARQFAEKAGSPADCFSEAEVAALRARLRQILRDRSPGGVARENRGRARRSPRHTYNEAFRLLGSHPRFDPPVEQVSRKALQCTSTDQRKAAFEATSGSGTRTMARGPATTGCPSRVP